MEEFLYNELKKIEDNQNQKIEGMFCLTHLVFVKNVAEKLGINAYYIEWGALRNSMYRKTAYWDNYSINKTYLERFNEFKEENVDVPILSRKEILALFLAPSFLNLIDRFDQRSNDFEVGIAGGYTTITDTRATTSLNIIEEYYEAKKYFDTNKICVRYHPGDPLHAKMNVPNELDGNMVDFLVRCKRVVCVDSKAELESMLWGNIVYDRLGFKYEGFVNSVLKSLEERVCSDEEISFLIFNTLIPFELLNSKTYLRYRINKSSEKELYLYHLKYYLQCLGIDYEEFVSLKEDRVNWIISKRNESVYEAKPLNKEFDDVKDNITFWRLNNKAEAVLEKNRQLLNRIDNLEADNKNLEMQITNLNNSTSMRITKPLRNIKDFLSKK